MYLEKKGYELEIKKYMTDGITVDELKEIVDKSGKRAIDFIRTQEKEYKELYKDKELSDDEWIDILAQNPKLLQRPVVINSNMSVIAIPPQEIDKII